MIFELITGTHIQYPAIIALNMLVRSSLEIKIYAVQCFKSLNHMKLDI